MVLFVRKPVIRRRRHLSSRQPASQPVSTLSWIIISGEFQGEVVECVISGGNCLSSHENKTEQCIVGIVTSWTADNLPLGEGRFLALRDQTLLDASDEFTWLSDPPWHERCIYLVVQRRGQKRKEEQVDGDRSFNLCKRRRIRSSDDFLN